MHSFRLPWTRLWRPGTIAFLVGSLGWRGDNHGISPFSPNFSHFLAARPVLISVLNAIIVGIFISPPHRWRTSRPWQTCGTIHT